MGKGIVMRRSIVYISMMLLVVVMTGIYSCTSLSSDDKAVRYYTFKELGELENIEVLEQQLCTLEPGTAAYCKKLIQYKINKSLQTFNYDTTLIAEIVTEVKKQADSTAYAPVVLYLESLGTYRSNGVAAYQLAIKVKELFEKNQDTCGIIRINNVLSFINFSSTTNEYIGYKDDIIKISNQTYELSKYSNYPVDRYIFLTMSMGKLKDTYCDSLFVFKIDSIIGEVQDLIHKNPNLAYNLSNIYDTADFITNGINQRLIKIDYIKEGTLLKVNPNRYLSYGNYSQKFYTPYQTDSIIKYTKLSMICNNGKDLLYLASQYKILADVYENIGNYPLAMKYMHQDDSLTNIINARIRQKEILEVQSKYDFQKINTEKVQLIKEKRNVTIAIVFISLILILFAGLLVYMKELIDKQKAWITLKDNIISVISHDLKSPMTAMFGTSKLVMDAIGKNDMDAVKRNYMSFNNYLSNMYGFTNNLLDWLTDKGHQETKASFGVLIQNLQLSILSYGQYKQVEVSFCDALLDQTYHEIKMAKGVEVIIRNLVSNIINHTDSSRIDICSEMSGGQMYISIKDDAPPMDDDTYDFVLARLQASDQGRIFMSQGFGLTLVRRFMDITNAAVEVKRGCEGNVYVVRVEVG